MKMARIAVIAMGLSGAVAARAQNNGGFETPALADGTYVVAPAGAGWIFDGGGGIGAIDSVHTSGAPEVPQGRQVAFLGDDASIRQTIAIDAGAVLTFTATQAPGTARNQLIQVLVDGESQPFNLGASQGRVVVDSVRPPRDYYETYAVRLRPGNPGPAHTLTIRGLQAGQDAMALLDGIAVSTTADPAYGFWDQGLVSGAWRSDLPTATTTFATGPCLATRPPPPIVLAGATPTPPAVPGAPWDCYGAPGSSFDYPRATRSNWYSHGYAAGQPHWIIAINNEPVAIPGCGSGPPNQSLPNNLSPMVRPGAAVLVSAATAAEDPAIGTRNIVQLVYNDTVIDRGACIPYLAFGASTHHGNEKPLAVVTFDDETHQPHLRFKQTVVAAESTTLAVSWLTLWTSGWSDQVRRIVQIQLGRQAVDDLYARIAVWNWNLVDSYYYPGGVAHHTNVERLNTDCNLGLPEVSFKNTYNGSGGSPSSITAYDIDLHALLACLAKTGAWEGFADQLPEPLVISGAEWALEQVQLQPDNPTYFPPRNAISVWGMRIE